MLLSALLAQRIPARGAITFGEFEVTAEEFGEATVFFGRALIDAYEAERAEKWIGITILPSAWWGFESNEPGSIETFAREGVWAKREDGSLLLNPFIKLRGAYDQDLTQEIEGSYREWDVPDFPNEVRALRFLRETAAGYEARGDYSGREAVKYHATIAFLRRMLGPELYAWATRVSEEEA